MYYSAGLKPGIFLTANIIAVICTSILILAIIFDFIIYHKPGTGKSEKRSRVATGTMVLYFLLFLVLIKSHLGYLKITHDWILISLMFLGGILVIVGCIINISGRISLRHNWSDQIVIYHDHSHVKSGIYRYIRHPLYSSLIMMFTGGAFIYTDYLALISIFGIFIPMVFIRGRQEEKVLMTEFPGYRLYKSQTGMFLPILFKKKKQLNQ
ncbi:MAG TPA: isoprenylcysteine carboxylmethyltransferase family protein [Lentimicrobium sp.]|nr:isoprenylcysteine carboxylmethyltransferase family protein [Lentimicrobium sp.]